MNTYKTEPLSLKYNIPEGATLLTDTSGGRVYAYKKDRLKRDGSSNGSVIVFLSDYGQRVPDREESL